MAQVRRRWTLAALSVLLGALVSAPATTARTGESCAAGTHRLDLGSGSAALMRVAPGVATGGHALLLVLHDARQSEADALATFRGSAGASGLVLLAPGVHGTSWSFERDGGDDLATVGRALTQAYARCAIDSRRVGIAGFGAGATAALSLGTRNGKLFRAIVALSPGSVEGRTHVGRPRIFVAHGTGDHVAPFAETRDVLVPKLRRAGYDVTFRPFDGGHAVPASVARAAVRWFLG